MTTQSNTGALDATTLAGYQEAFEAQPAHQLMQNVVTQHDVNDVALNRNIVAEATHTFSTTLDEWGVTNQARSGRCWMFAGLNLFRSETRNLLKVKEFEFSQSYVMFWDKMERANYILEAVIETADRPIDDRVVAWLLHQPLGDGGQWDMFVSLVKKHGGSPQDRHA
ncbi:Bleomycin hydrolase (Fragment) [Geodia barretti]|uniref:Bleomycin hydrolase n=1 Tax=Geodia barretti TaxID=519541 RepID=A0AA35RP01_GEOBA